MFLKKFREQEKSDQDFDKSKISKKLSLPPDAVLIDLKDGD